MHARASVKRRSRETRETRVSRLQSRAWSFACLRRFARRTKKKERLVVVYPLISHNAFNAKCLQSYRMSHPKIWVKLPPKNVHVCRLKFLCLTHYCFSYSTTRASLVTYAEPSSKLTKSASPLQGRKRTQVASCKSWMARSNSFAAWSPRPVINVMFFRIQVPGWMTMGWVMTDWLTERLNNWKIG